MPEHLRPIIEPYVLVGDVTIIGYFFIGGSVFFEKQERTLGAVICSPLRFWEYVSVKITVLMAISLFVALVVVTVVHGTDFHPVPLVVGVVLGTLVMLLAGFASALPFASVSDWFLSTTVPLAILALRCCIYLVCGPAPCCISFPPRDLCCCSQRFSTK